MFLLLLLLPLMLLLPLLVLAAVDGASADVTEDDTHYLVVLMVSIELPDLMLTTGWDVTPSSTTHDSHFTV